MDDYAHITKCIELTEEDIRSAIESREATRALLARLAHVSAPGTGIAKSLLVLSRMATTACEWLDGDLRIEIVGDADVCAVEVLVEMGLGMRERVFPPFAFRAPLEEIARAIDRVPRLIAPLATLAKTERRIVLGATADIRRSSLPPAPVRIAEASIFVPKAPPAVQAPAAESPGAGPALPVVTPTLPIAQPPQRGSARASSKPPKKASLAPRVSVTGKRITIVKEAPPPELPVVTPAKKSARPASPAVAPPAPAPAEAPDEDDDDVDSGWGDT